MAVKITWYGHSCFVLETEGYRIALDPYADYVPGYEPLDIEANEVFCSHDHQDHAYLDGVRTVPGGESPFAVTEYHSFHDPEQGALRGPNTIRVFEAEGKRIAHLGDIGCEPTKEILDALKNLDVVMIPVGGTYTFTAEEANAFLKKIAPKVVIPMHYRRDGLGFEVLQDIEEFLSMRDDVILYMANCIAINGNTISQTAVLSYKGSSTSCQ